MKKEMFNKIAAKYDFLNNIISFGLHKYIKMRAVKALEIQPDSKVLDLCCGSGDLGKMVKEIQPSCDVIGVDFSSKMIELARFKNQNITYWELDALNLPFEKNSFDYVLMGFGLRNINDKRKVIEEIHKILKSNGKFLQLDFGKKNIYSKIFDNIVLFLIKFFTKNTKPYRYLILSKKEFPEPKELINLISSCNFRCILSENLLLDIISYQIFKK